MSEVEQEVSTEIEAAPEETQAPAVEGQDQQAKADETAAAPAVEAANVEDKPETVAFTPNVKFKVLEKEMEIPKEYHSLMKDAASEKAVRELFEKANGLDIVKEKLANTRAEREQAFQEAQSYKSAIGKARNIYQSAVQSGNMHKMDDFFKTLGVSPDHVMAYAIEKAKLQEMDPQQRQLIEAKIQAERFADSEQENRQSLQAQMQQQQLQMKAWQLETTLSKPEISQAASRLEQMFQKPGLFRQEVIAAGEQAWYSEGKDIPVPEAIERVMSKYGLSASQQVPAQAQATQQFSGKKVIQKQAPTIPNVTGSNGSSPLQNNKPKSLDDIKKLRDKALRGENV